MAPLAPTSKHPEPASQGSERSYGIMPRVLMDLPGGVVEWLMALVLKTSVPKGTVGSNPTPSVETTS